MTQQETAAGEWFRYGGRGSRVSVRAVTSGALVCLVALAVLLTLGGGLGVWRTRVAEGGVQGPGAGFYLWASLSWIATSFLGGLVSALVSRSPVRRDGLLHGLVTWAAACLTGCVLATGWLVGAMSMGLLRAPAGPMAVDRAALLTLFLADVLALAASMLGGSVGAQSEAAAAEGAAAVGAARGRERPFVPAAPPAPTPRAT